MIWGVLNGEILLSGCLLCRLVTCLHLFQKGSRVGARQHVKVTRDSPITEECIEEKRGSQLGMPELKYVCKKCWALASHLRRDLPWKIWPYYANIINLGKERGWHGCLAVQHKIVRQVWHFESCIGLTGKRVFRSSIKDMLRKQMEKGKYNPLC